MFTLLASLALVADPVAVVPVPCIGICYPWTPPPKPGKGPKPK